MTRPNTSDYGIDGSNSEISQVLAELIEMGLVVDSGERRLSNGEWKIVWKAVESRRAREAAQRIEEDLKERTRAE